MPTKTITMPSGLAGEIRNLKAKEMSALADPANARAQKKGGKNRVHPLDPILDGCWLATTDPGPYALVEGAKPVWPKVLLCDRFYLLLQIRDVTWGDYEFKVKCRDTSCPRHKKPFLWEADLNLLEFKELPAASRERVAAFIKTGDKANLQFDITVAGRACKYALKTGGDEANGGAALADDAPSHKKLLAQVASRIYEVSGIETDDERIDWVGELDIPDLYAAVKEMDSVDGGVETRTIVECPDCAEEFTIDLPFGDSGFLAPTPT